jgi:hypothetical protein
VGGGGDRGGGGRRGGGEFEHLRVKIAHGLAHIRAGPLVRLGASFLPLLFRTWGKERWCRSASRSACRYALSAVSNRRRSSSRSSARLRARTARGPPAAAGVG